MTTTEIKVGDRVRRAYEVDCHGEDAPVYRVTWAGINYDGEACVEIEPTGRTTGRRETWQCTDVVPA